MDISLVLRKDALNIKWWFMMLINVDEGSLVCVVLVWSNKIRNVENQRSEWIYRRSRPYINFLFSQVRSSEVVASHPVAAT